MDALKPIAARISRILFGCVMLVVVAVAAAAVLVVAPCLIAAAALLGAVKLLEGPQ